MLSDFAHWLLSIISTVIQFLVDLPFKLIEWIWNAFIAFLDLLPIGSYLNQSAGLFSSIPSSVWFFMDMLQIKLGITTILGAYLIRFLIRRIPGIG